MCHRIIKIQLNKELTEGANVTVVYLCCSYDFTIPLGHYILADNRLDDMHNRRVQFGHEVLRGVIGSICTLLGWIAV